MTGTVETPVAGTYWETSFIRRSPSGQYGNRNLASGSSGSDYIIEERPGDHMIRK